MVSQLTEVCQLIEAKDKHPYTLTQKNVGLTKEQRTYIADEVLKYCDFDLLLDKILKEIPDNSVNYGQNLTVKVPDSNVIYRISLTPYPVRLFLRRLGIKLKPVDKTNEIKITQKSAIFEGYTIERGILKKQSLIGKIIKEPNDLNLFWVASPATEGQFDIYERLTGRRVFTHQLKNLAQLKCHYSEGFNTPEKIEQFKKLVIDTMMEEF